LINECEVLIKYHGIKPTCINSCNKVRMNSYRNGGCLIAHVILVLRELKLIEKWVMEITTRSFKRMVSKLYRHDRYLSVKNEDLTKYLSELYRLAIIFHDLGKLTNTYTSEKMPKWFRHEIPSWIYMLLAKEPFHELLKNYVGNDTIDTLNDGNIKIYEQATLAVLIHHESYIWEWAEEYKLMTDIIYEVSRTLYSKLLSSKHIEYLRINKELLNRFILGLRSALKYGLISDKALNTLTKLSSKYEEIISEPCLLFNRVSSFIRSLNTSTLRRALNSRLTFTIYYILFMVDNRAASARDDISNYWLTKYRSLVESLKSKADYELLLRSLTKASKGNALHVSLSFIPP